MKWAVRLTVQSTIFFSFVALAVAPFNLIKSAIDGVVTFVLYKYLSRHLKETV
ncbi:MAG: hypothetical protein ACLRWA_01970 [Lachnospira sp.]